MPEIVQIATGVLRRDGDVLVRVLRDGLDVGCPCLGRGAARRRPRWSRARGRLGPAARGPYTADLISWQSLTARYLRGELEPGSLWLRRVHEDGREEWLGSF